MPLDWFDKFTGQLEAMASEADSDAASGLVVELITSFGHVELIGPFPKDTVEAFDVIEFLRSEEDSENEPNVYKVRLLFPPTFAQLQ